MIRRGSEAKEGDGEFGYVVRGTMIETGCGQYDSLVHLDETHDREIQTSIEVMWGCP